MPQNSQSQQPLTGYRVLDLSDEKGVYCGKLLADMGADVIKVEPPGGNPMRRMGPFVHGEPHPERSLHWLHFNTNKRSVTLDVTTGDGARLFRRLVPTADVILETFQPGVMASLGLGYEELGQSSPGLIYLSITPFGQTGPHSHYRGSDITGFAMGGYMYVTGRPHTPPARLWGSQAYHTASNRAFIAVLLALYDRVHTGLGQHIDVSMQEAVAATTEHVGVTYLYVGKSAVRQGFLHAGLLVATFKCRDGFVSITTNTRRAWDDLRAWMDAEGMAGDLMEEKYNDSFLLRGAHSGHIEDLITRWAMNRTREEIMQWGQERHHPFGPVATPAEIMENPQLWDRGFFIGVEHPESGASLVYPGAPYQLPQSPWRLRRTAPEIGEHNGEVYRQELGLSAEELSVLANNGVI